MLVGMSSSPVPYPLRMPEELREYLTAQAKQHNRSLHAEIIGILQGAMGKAEPAVEAAAGPTPVVDVDALAEALTPKLAEEIAAIVAARLREPEA